MFLLDNSVDFEVTRMSGSVAHAVNAGRRPKKQVADEGKRQAATSAWVEWLILSQTDKPRPTAMPILRPPCTTGGLVSP